MVVVVVVTTLLAGEESTSGFENTLERISGLRLAGQFKMLVTAGDAVVPLMLW